MSLATIAMQATLVAVALLTVLAIVKGWGEGGSCGHPEHWFPNPEDE